MVKYGIAVAIALSMLGAACDTGKQASILQDHDPTIVFSWQLPEGFPTPRVPHDNPMTLEKIELGRQLFHDTRLSGDNTVSCASCHQPELAYTDGRPRAIGVKGNIHPRSAMSLTNVAYNATLGWDDPDLTSLEDQIRVPLYNMRPPEMGLTRHEEHVLERFKRDRRVRKHFSKAFPEDSKPVTIPNIISALAAFERTLISGNSAYDQWAYGGDVSALNPDERVGAGLFFSRRLSCFHCHAGFNFSGPVVYKGSEDTAARFHNTGLYNLDGYDKPNTGVYRHTGLSEDMGKFRAPTLRNIALTAPYMHDGSIPTLEAVIDHYMSGGRDRTAGYGERPSNSRKGIDPLISGFELNAEERRQLIGFLKALTDESFITKAMEQAAR